MPRFVAFAAILIASAAAETFPLPCRYIPADPLASSRSDNCAVRREGRVVVSKAVLKKMDFSENGFGRARIDHSWYYVKRNGTTLSVITFDNGADYFSEGLVRSSIGGKIAYFDMKFRQVIPPRYDWGWPFENGRALVCLGCVESPPDNDGHTRLEGGTWGYIDRKGREILSATHSREEAINWLRQR